MRGRWQLYTSNLIVFSLWYVLIYVLVSGAFEGVLGALAGALLALAAGLITGVVVGAAAHAIDLHLTHRAVRAGDARDGARITLGKLPKPVARQSDSPAPPVAETPAIDPVSVPKPAPVAAPEPAPVDSHAAASSTPATPASSARLVAECAAFAGSHEGVLVAPASDGRGAVGNIYRAAAPGQFADFLELIGRLAKDGVDVAAVQVTQDGDGVPSVVTFPVFPGDEGEIK